MDKAGWCTLEYVVEPCKQQTVTINIKEMYDVDAGHWDYKYPDIHVLRIGTGNPHIIEVDLPHHHKTIDHTTYASIYLPPSDMNDAHDIHITITSDIPFGVFTIEVGLLNETEICKIHNVSPTSKRYQFICKMLLEAWYEKVCSVYLMNRLSAQHEDGPQIDEGAPPSYEEAIRADGI